MNLLIAGPFQNLGNSATKLLCPGNMNAKNTYSMWATDQMNYFRVAD
jgi:hypothetical protein